MFETLCLLEKLKDLKPKEKVESLTYIAKNSVEYTEKLKFIFDTVFNPYVTMGISNFDDGNIYRYDIPTLDDLKLLRQSLIKRELTGNGAIDEMRHVLLCDDNVARYWLVKTFKRDLKHGMGPGLVNKVFPKFLPSFDCGLCDSYEKDVTKLDGDWFAERKIDGFRCLVFATYTSKQMQLKFVSRNNKPFNNYEHIENELSNMLVSYAEKTDKTSFVIDGELMADDWNMTSKILTTESEHPDKLTIKFNIFDLFDGDGWITKTTKSYAERRKDMIELTLQTTLNYVQLVDAVFIKDTDALESFYESVLAEGYEGVVLKNSAAQYPFGRGGSWLKYKPVNTEEAVIMDCIEGRTGTKYVGMLGSFKCKFPGRDDEDTFECGGGLKDSERAEFWQNRDSMIGQLIEVKFNGLTKDGKARFPRFKRLRTDRALAL